MQANQHPPTMTPQSGSRLRRGCLRIPKRTSCAGVWGWNTAALGSHCVPLSLTTTTTLLSGTALSTSTYFPVSENTWANLVGGAAPGGEHRHCDGEPPALALALMLQNHNTRRSDACCGFATLTPMSMVQLFCVLPGVHVAGRNFYAALLFKSRKPQRVTVPLLTYLLNNVFKTKVKAAKGERGEEG